MLSDNRAGAISSLHVGNGLWESAQFNNRLQVTQLGLGTSVADTSLWRLNYEFGEIDAAGSLNTAKNNGNVAKITTTSPVGVYTQSYRYDSLDRLKDAWENSGATQNWTQNFQYDRYGNRIAFQQTKTGQPNYNYTPTVDANTNGFTAVQHSSVTILCSDLSLRL